MLESGRLRGHAGASMLSTLEDATEFGRLAARHRRELLVHCRRVLGSSGDAEDVVQETLLRAWRSRATPVRDDRRRAWLYRIATNACLDAIQRRTPSVALPADVSAAGGEPDDLVARRETLELAFLAALEQLTPRQRAAFFLRDVLDWSARDTAAVLGVSVPAANSALQRARERLRDALPLQRREDWRGPSRPTRRGRALLDRLVAV
jgi:RNA polymerase sigma-70 factor (ECF subfamily)